MTVSTINRRRIALVTGSGQGLGAEVSRQLSQRGCIVIATSRRMPHVGDSAVDIHFAEMDVKDELQVRSVIVDAATRFGGIDILINNAGVYLDREDEHSPEFLPLSLLYETIDVNLLGAARTMAAVIPIMIGQGSGVIVNVSSGMGRSVELAGNALYYRTSKAALTALSRCAARRLEPHGIVVNAVCPGWVRTRMGTQRAVRSIEKGATGIVDAALTPRTNGVLLRDSEDFGW